MPVRVLQHLIELPRAVRRWLLFAMDLVLATLCVWLAFHLRFGDLYPAELQQASLLYPLAIAVTALAYLAVGLQTSMIRYAGSKVLFDILRGATYATMLLGIAWYLVGSSTVPRSFWPIYWLLLVSATGGMRLSVRHLILGRIALGKSPVRVLIYGAGEAGLQLALALRHGGDYLPVAFLDDDQQLQGAELVNLTVHAPETVEQLLVDREIDAVLLALPTVSRQRRREILQRLSHFPVHVMEMPTLEELASGKRRLEELQPIEIEDILGRDEVAPNQALLEGSVRDKVVMVTGAGGSIGSALCRQIARLQPERLVLLDHSEYALYTITQELTAQMAGEGQTFELVPVLGSITNAGRMHRLMGAYKVRTVYHAAAYKHVPIVESNPIQGAFNNIVGTLRLAEAAVANRVERFILVSTDKAVRPTNVMGATKRCAELILQAMATRTSRTRFCMVRFGNVLASSGSVVPLFREQIRAGGPITVTHPNITRYFMTIPEAAQLVLQAGSMGTHGEVYVLDMGEPVRIVDLARRMVHLAGLNVIEEGSDEGDIAIEFTGLRPGEKLYEELLIGEDDSPTLHPMIRSAQERMIPWDQLMPRLGQLETMIKSERSDLVAGLLEELVQGYVPSQEIKDTIWQRTCGQCRRHDTALCNELNEGYPNCMELRAVS